MTAADELRTAAASIRAGDMPADPEKFLEAVATLLGMQADHACGQGTVCDSCVTYSVAVARAWNAELP